MAAVCKALADKKLYIADGHHRYETMLALRERLAQEAGQLDPRSAAQYGMMFLASADDPGLIVLPTHRLIHSVVDFDWPATLARLQAYFTVSIIAGGASKPDAVRDALRAAKAQAPCFAAVVPGNPDAVLLSLNPSVQLATLGLQGSEVLLQLDVTLLHELVLDRCLGIGAAAQEAKTNIRYIKDTAEALSRGVSGEGQVCFLMSATPVSQVLAVSDAGEVMPQKSTFFYPKLASGVVLNPVDPAELL